jgi:hypothetical protein
MAIRDRLDLSLEAATRCLVEHHGAPLAAVWSKDGRIQCQVRNDRFPWLVRKIGAPVSALSLTAQALAAARLGFTDMSECASAAWTDREGVEICEQVRVGREGRAVTLLCAEPSVEGDR